MNKVEKTVLVMHSAEEMFTLVDSIENYPSFLPWCSRSEVLERTESQTTGTLHIDYHGVKQNFTTVNDWQFIELSPDACKIAFNLQYQFANQLLEKVVSPVFSYIATTFVDSFVAHADKVYGDKKEIT